MRNPTLSGKVPDDMRSTPLSLRWRIARVAAAAALAGGGTLAAASPALADYGPGATYQVELSANISGPHGGGVWLWFALDRNGTGDYQGSDCPHGGPGAAADSGTVTWSSSGDQVVISGVVLNGLGGFPATVTVPATDGHYTGTVGSFITLPPFIPPATGDSQLQVSP
jgi:hypothetical protein